MSEKIEILVILLGIIGVLAVVAERLRFPFPILLVFAGLGIALIPRLPEIRVDPNLVFLIFLPPLLFSAAWNFPWYDFRANLLPIFALAVGLVFATILSVAYVSHWLIPGLSLAAAFTLGAIVAPPDAVAATAVLKNVRVPRRLATLLGGESLVNDSSGLVAYQFAMAAAITGSFSMADASADFVWMSVGGIIYGWLVGHAAAWIHRRLTDPAVEITLTILTPYLAYLPAEQLGFSGVLAVVAAGLHIGHRSWEALTSESRLQRDAIWQFIDYLLNSLVFILIGLQFPTIVQALKIPWWQMVLIGVVISLTVVATRFAWFFPVSWIERFIFRRHTETNDALTTGGLVVASWAGMRGVVSMAAALALPENFPHRHVILFLTFCVIFATLVFQGLSLPWVARRLKVESTEDEFGSEAKARVILLDELIAGISRIAAESKDEHDRESLELWRAYYEERLKHLKLRLSVPRKVHQPTALREKKVLPEVMMIARRHLSDMRRQGLISEDVRRRIENDFDLEEQRIQRVLARALPG